MSTSFFAKNELDIAILNAGSSDVIWVGYSISMNMKSGAGLFSRGRDKIVFDPSFKGQSQQRDGGR
jgi:hypothetical protein